MRAGELRNRIKFYAKAATTTVGQPTNAYTVLVHDAWASIEGIAGGEALRGDQVNATATTRIKIRYTDKVNAAHVAVFQGRQLAVVRAYDPDGRRVELICECRENG